MSNFNIPTLPDRLKEGEKGAAVMFSGGMDSSVILADLIRKGYTVYPIALDDGTLNFKLRRSVALELTTQQLGVYNRLIVARIPELEVLRRSTSGFGFIPGMKLLMIITAMSYCQTLNVDKLYMGYNTDNGIVGGGNFRDEGSLFMDKVSDLFYETYGLEKNTEFYFGRRIEVVNPYFDLYKSDMVRLGRDLGFDFGTTISCRQIKVGAGLVHCGNCEVCYRRRLSFIDADFPDPTIWQIGSRCWTSANDGSSLKGKEYTRARFLKSIGYPSDYGLRKNGSTVG